MRREWRIWALVWAVVVTVPVSVAAAALSSSSRVGPTGVGPIVFGMTPAQATATGTAFVTTKPSRGSTCFYLRPRSLRGLSFMVEHGTIRRAEVVTSTIRTTDGLRVGDPGVKVTTFYRQRARLTPDKYDQKAQTITILPKGSADAKYRTVFTVKGGMVQMIVAGALPQVLYVEGCS